MTPFDYAKTIVPVDVVGSNFVVSLGDAHWRLVLSMDRSAQRADHIALIARQIVERCIIKAMADAYCHVAARLDEQRLSDEQAPTREQFAMWCRNQAASLSCIQLIAYGDDQTKT